MLIFDITHTTLSGTALLHGCMKYHNVIDLIERTNEFEKAGFVVLLAAFVFGLWVISSSVFVAISSHVERPTSRPASKGLKTTKRRTCSPKGKRRHK
jgi:hypothetical protein